MKPDKQLKFLDSPETQRKFRKYFYISLCVLLLIDIGTLFLFERQGHFPWEEVPFFSAVYGFTACVGLIFIARILRWIVKRKEAYYD
jgi:NADH:ubiquinone oxidoreductase subunit 3 (subunit A)